MAEDETPVPVVASTPPPPPPPKPVPKTFTAEEVKEAEKIVTQTYYRLKFRAANGNIRADISKELVRQLSVDWGDLLRVIPNYRWSTIDEIVTLVLDFENRSIRKAYTRTRKQIVDGVLVLLQAGVLEEKP